VSIDRPLHQAAVSPPSAPTEPLDLVILAHRTELLRTLTPGIIHQLASAGQGLLAARSSPKALEEVTRRLNKVHGVLSALAAELAIGEGAERGSPSASIEHVLGEVDLLQSCQITLPRARLEFVTSAPLPPGHIRPEHLRDALAAIITNAKEAMVGLEAGEIRVSTALKPPWITITVANDGPGFSRRALDRAFEPCNTTKTSGGHLGLGLAVARQMLRHAGGDVRVTHSERPTTVELTIPVRTSNGGRST
jgi:C4-dicarboxylate-specific signal transduction histidine kinase